MTQTATPWFRRWFGGDYLALYPHRDRAEARRAVDLLRAATGLGPGSRVLDLGCGAGRHLAEMRRLGYLATGLDLSMRMLRAAQERGAAAKLRLVRADMRILPFRSASFDLVTSYFTSFGYFDSESEDLGVLLEVRRALAPGGCLLLDFFNSGHVVRTLRDEDRRTVAGVEVVQRRRLVEEGRVVEKRITVAGASARPTRNFVERVRLYAPEEIDGLAERAGMRPKARFGGYDRSAFTPDSPRYIVLAEALAESAR